MPQPTRTLLARLLERGDVVEVNRGRLTVIPASGGTADVDWLDRHERQLIIEAALAAGVEPLEYLSYTVGNYGPSKYGGVSLQFRNLADGSERYTIFNAETRRSRSTAHGNKGSPLPRGQFRVTKRFKFYGFWLSTGLPIPRRLSAFHDYMGNLKSLVFTSSGAIGERLGDPLPLTLSYATLARLVNNGLQNTHRTNHGQTFDNFRTSLPDKESPALQQQCGPKEYQSTGVNKHGNMVKRDHGYTGTSISPEDQTNEEWLAAYDSAN